MLFMKNTNDKRIDPKYYQGAFLTTRNAKYT